MSSKVRKKKIPLVRTLFLKILKEVIAFHRFRQEYAKRVVIKIGSTSLITESLIDYGKLFKFVLEVSKLHKQGFDVVIVTSGAISNGNGVIGSKNTIIDKQTAAAVGQAYLISAYATHFAKNRIKIGQILLKRSDFCKKHDIVATINMLLKKRVVPIINENDVTSLDGINGKWDNDIIAAKIARAINADLLIILTDVDGLLVNGKRISKILRIKKCFVKAANTCGRNGGMLSKIKAAKIVRNKGIATVVANSAERDILSKILRGDNVGTKFEINK